MYTHTQSLQPFTVTGLEPQGLWNKPRRETTMTSVTQRPDIQKPTREQTKQSEN